MRTIELKADECPSAGAGCVDWKDPPMVVLLEVDRMLADISMEIVILETGDDSYIWTIEPREEDNLG